MSETGQAPESGLPERPSTDQAVGQPAGPYSAFLDEPDQAVVVEDDEEDDVLLMPGAQRAWGDAVPAARGAAGATADGAPAPGSGPGAPAGGSSGSNGANSGSGSGSSGAGYSTPQLLQSGAAAVDPARPRRPLAGGPPVADPGAFTGQVSVQPLTARGGDARVQAPPAEAADAPSGGAVPHGEAVHGSGSFGPELAAEAEAVAKPSATPAVPLQGPAVLGSVTEGPAVPASHLAGTSQVDAGSAGPAAAEGAPAHPSGEPEPIPAGQVTPGPATTQLPAAAASGEAEDAEVEAAVVAEPAPAAETVPGPRRESSDGESEPEAASAPAGEPTEAPEPAAEAEPAPSPAPTAEPAAPAAESDEGPVDEAPAVPDAGPEPAADAAPEPAPGTETAPEAAAEAAAASGTEPTPAPDADQEPAAEATAAPEPAVAEEAPDTAATNPEPAAEASPAPEPERFATESEAAAPEPVAEAVPEPAPEAEVEPTQEPAAEAPAAPEPAVAAPAPAVEAEPEPVPADASGPAAEAPAAPEPAADPVATDAAESVPAEPVPVTDAAPEPAPGSEPAAEAPAAPEPAVAAPAPAAPEPAAEPAPEPAAEPAPEPAAAASAPAAESVPAAEPEPVPAAVSEPVEAKPKPRRSRRKKPTVAAFLDDPGTLTLPTPEPQPEPAAPAAGSEPAPVPEEKPEPVPEAVAATPAGPVITNPEPEALGTPVAGPLTVPARPETPQVGDPTPPRGLKVAKGDAHAYEPSVREAVHRVIRDRRDAPVGFRPGEPVEDAELTRVLTAAHTAGDGAPPWDFVVHRSEESRERLRDEMVRQHDAHRAALPKGRAKQFSLDPAHAPAQAPVCVAVTADPTRTGGRPGVAGTGAGASAPAVENLLLAARAEGLAVASVEIHDERGLAAVLGLPEHVEVVALLCLGRPDPDAAGVLRPARPAAAEPRRPLAWVVHDEEYGRRGLPGGEPLSLMQETLRLIRPLDAKALGEAWERQKRMTKPAGSLGVLEIISAQLCGLSRKCPPPVPEPAAVAVFAGDHGVHGRGVTSWAQEVTAQMVGNLTAGGAVANAFANQIGAEVCVVDVGVAADLPAAQGLLPRKVRRGTADITAGPAMTRAEAQRAVEVGIETARDLVAAGNRALITGDMGVANTTSSAALVAAFTGAEPPEVTGRGAGADDEMHDRKVAVVREALALHKPDTTDPMGVLASLGGLEHAGIVGLLLGAASLRTPVLLDGLVAGAAALVAKAIAPEVLAACIAGHRSAEPGHRAALGKLGLRPLVDLDLRLGEGTGALLALPLVQSAARAMHDVATFDSAGVTAKR